MFQLTPVSLAIVETQGITIVTPLPGHGQSGGGINSTRYKYNYPFSLHDIRRYAQTGGKSKWQRSRIDRLNRA
jgi:hypothetical protein